uniref:Major facilitator superfamily (MFS) profile domain-containing protein n=1 Tax=Salix viminalis TaxID=40686 RepID=A0A6N2L8N6_SALVM
MARTENSALLEKKKEYYENCPGCKIDRLNEEQRGVPYRNLSYIWTVSLCTGASIHAPSFVYMQHVIVLLFPCLLVQFFISPFTLLHVARKSVVISWGCHAKYLSINLHNTAIFYLSALPISSLFPFIYFMIRDFHIAEIEEDIGFYAGFVGSSFMIGRALTSFFWGWLADRYGRKPIILIGTSSVVLFNALFGLSTSLWMALSMRFLLGCFNSLLGTIRAYASEVCREEYRSVALSVVSTSRGIGMIIGPAIGGFLAQPAEKFPNLFAESSIFGRFPYFLPCLVISVYAVGVLAACWWLPETLHMHDKKVSERCDSFDVLEASSEESDEKEYVTEVKERKISKNANLLRNWPLMSVIIVYCVFSLQEIAYAEMFSLWAVSDKKYGGLSFSSQDVGEVLAISGEHTHVLSFMLLIELYLSTLGLQPKTEENQECISVYYST